MIFNLITPFKHICTQLRTSLYIKWNESGFRPPLCTYRLNWARRTSWGWWDDWDDTVLQTQDSKFEPWRSEAEHATSRSRRLPTILTFTRGWGRNNFVSFKPPRPGTEPRTLVKGSGANHYPRAPAPSLYISQQTRDMNSMLNSTVVQHWSNIEFMSRVCWDTCTQQTQNNCMTFVQRRPNVFDVGPTLYKCQKMC